MKQWPRAFGADDDATLLLRHLSLCGFSAVGTKKRIVRDLLAADAEHIFHLLIDWPWCSIFAFPRFRSS
jgi:hypothetical protein